VLVGLCVCAVLSAGPLVLAQGATAGLRPDPPPKLPQRPPQPAPPPPAASTTPAPDPAPAPPPATPPSPTEVVPAAQKQAPAPARASQRTRQARATSAVRAAAARARKRHVEMTQARRSRGARAVRTVTAVRRLPAAAYAISSSKSRTGVFLGLALTLLAGGCCSSARFSAPPTSCLCRNGLARSSSCEARLRSQAWASSRPALPSHSSCSSSPSR
jgi:hypothetical protein